MKTLIAIALVLTSFVVWSQSITYKYCTNVGPVELTIDGESVTGKYVITVTPADIYGKLTGAFHNGLMEGEWDDPDGKGRMIMAFTGDRSRFTAVYTAYKRDPDHWYSEWKAVSVPVYDTLSPEKRKSYSCRAKH
ncbi:hypothetical protein WBG78_25905 [Chryseolinea sp. T2]|uniref:hypothetical protein n=1 Tax=Chryseolinea sp. T2 TaxID=3129255 RepID=UPI0030771385